MSYTKTVWEDLPSTDTPLNATNLNNIEDGIEDIDQEVEGVSQSLGVDTNTYDNTATYSVGDKVIYENKIYECNTDISTAEDFDSSKWDLVPVIDNMKINNKLLSSTIVDTTNTDLNDYKTSGIYYFRVDYAPTNRPTGSNGWLEVFTGEQGGDIVVKQIWYRHGTPNSTDWDTYVRTYSGGWSDWKKYVDTNTFKTLRVTATTDSNGFFRTGISRAGNVVLGGRTVTGGVGRNGFYIPFSEGITWTLKCMNWDMTTTGFVSTQITVDVIYAELP